MDPTIADLCELIQKLSDKIDRLEKVIKTNGCAMGMGFNTPEVNIDDWSRNFVVREDDVETVYRDGGLDAMKNCVLYNNSLSSIPLTMNKNILYVFEETGWSKWTEEHLRTLIKNIWQKFVYIHMNTPVDPSVEEELRDFHRKKIIEMRKTVYDVKKNRVEFARYLKGVSAL